MDSINKNFPVGQPDANGNYVWMQVKAGGGISVTGDVEVNDGDLNMNGGTIRNAVFDPPVSGGSGPIYAVNTPPLILGITANQTINAGDIPSVMAWDEIVSRPINPSGGRPYIEYFAGDDIRIYESGVYEVTLQIYGYMEIPGPSPPLTNPVEIEMSLFVNNIPRDVNVNINRRELILFNEEPAANVLTKQDCACTKTMVTITPADIAVFGDYARCSIINRYYGTVSAGIKFTYLAEGIGGAGDGYHLASFKKVSDF